MSWREDNDYALALSRKYKRMDRRNHGPSFGERVANKTFEVLEAVFFLAAGGFVIWLML